MPAEECARGDDPVSHGEIPLINVTGIASYGTGFADAVFIQNNQNWQDVLSINRGAHAFKAGVTVQCGSGCPGAGALFHNTYARVVYGFNNVFDFARDDVFSESNIGFDPKTGKAAGPDFRPVFLNYGLFAQDDWKVTPRLTLNLGVRYSHFAQPTDRNNELTTFDPSLYSASLAPTVDKNGLILNNSAQKVANFRCSKP